MEQDKSSMLEKDFQKLMDDANELYPDLDNTLEIFNSNRTPTEEYLNYLSLLNELPLAVASNHVAE